MAIDPLRIAESIQKRFNRYLKTTFKVSSRYPELAAEVETGINQPGRLFGGPFLQGLPPYQLSDSIEDLVKQGALPGAIRTLPFLGEQSRPLYSHQSQAIRLLRKGENVVVASGTGSGKTLCFLVPILSEILENPVPGIHGMLLYPMNALVQDQLKVLRGLLKNRPDIRFGRYVNINITPKLERDGRRLNPDALPNEVVSRQQFQENPPHILITNFAMLEYLLLRAGDSPLFDGPWRFICLDEAHTYTGAKGSEVALLMRRLVARVRKPGQPPPQFLASSATIGASSKERRQAVARFAETLFNAPFGENVVEAQEANLPLEGRVFPSQSLYTDPVLTSCCEARQWSQALSHVLQDGGFPEAVISLASQRAVSDFDEALCQVFNEDARIAALRNCVKGRNAPDLTAAAFEVFGRRDVQAVNALIGLVRVASLAKYPGSDSRLVPCRYHFFVRGLSGAYVAFDHVDDKGNPGATLFFEPTLTTPGGLRTLELVLCRKCGQPYLSAYQFAENGTRVLRAFGAPLEDRGKRIWLTWVPPTAVSEDEEDLIEEESDSGERAVFCSRCGSLASDGSDCQCRDKGVQLPLWLLKEGEAPQTCFACGGRNTLTSLKAAADAAQAVVAESFYRHLPESKSEKAHYYPGKGRKLLCFSDSRQQAAYFAPYLQNTHNSQTMRWIVTEAIRLAGNQSTKVSAVALVDHMARLAEEIGLAGEDRSAIERDSRTALVAEFCLPWGRRQSLEALAVADLEVALPSFYEFPDLSGLAFTRKEQLDLIQILLGTLRVQKAITLPAPLSPNMKEFEPKTGLDAIVAKDSEPGRGYRLHGFAPCSRVLGQRRGYFLKQVLARLCERGGRPELPDKDVLEVLYRIWTSLTDLDGPAQALPLTRVTLAPGKVGYQIQWASLRFSLPNQWYYCPACGQWSARSVLATCPSFRCGGRLIESLPAEVSKDNHYRLIYTAESHPVPLIAKEHTAQIAPELATLYQQAFQEGHSGTGQINVLSCSTTFELGVDLGDLEAVFLRDMPPGPANYQQRAGRAGRGAGTAAFVVTFALPRSHDQYFFSIPEEMVTGEVVVPRINLANEVIIRRHISSVLLSDFMRRQRGREIRTVGSFMDVVGQNPAPVDDFLSELPMLVNVNRETVASLIPPSFPDTYIERAPETIGKEIAIAREHYLNEKLMFEEALEQARERRSAAEQARDFPQERRISGFIAYLGKRLEALSNQKDWVSFLSDRNVLPLYAFPIYNVTLETSDPDLKLDRDLRIALSEYAPGARIVAKERLWESVGIKLPPRGALPSRYYSRCPKCWHVRRHPLDPNCLGGPCPVCGDSGTQPARRTYHYLVPEHGFTTDLQESGREISFDQPLRISSSRVHFVPQQEVDDPVVTSLESGTKRLSVRTTEKADFFVFNSGPDGAGFLLCQSCGRLVERGPRGRAHTRPFGGECNGLGKFQHLAHEFRGTAARLVLEGTGHDYLDHPFWLSLLYAVLGGTSKALEIDRSDIDGIICSSRIGSAVFQELVLFDNVPGGAGHVRRLEDQENLIAVLEAAHRLVESCSCGRDASCYRCLRSYGNQYFHDLLQRGPAADFLGDFVLGLTKSPAEDVEYRHSDAAYAIRSLLESSAELFVAADSLTASGPPDIGPWYLLLQTCANRIGEHLRLAVAEVPERTEHLAPLLMLRQAGAKVLKRHDQTPAPRYAILGVTPDGRRGAFRWESGTTVLDGGAHRRKLWHNRSTRHLATAQRALERWFEENTAELSLFDLLRSGYETLAVPAGSRPDFQTLFAAGLDPGIERVLVQDPYLRNEHQIECLGKLFAALHPLVCPGEQARVSLVTKLSDMGKDRFALPPIKQRERIEETFKQFFGFQLDLQFRPIRDPMHARFLFIETRGQDEVLFYLDRGFDIIDPKTGKARGGPILKFVRPTEDLKEVLFGRRQV